MKRQNLWSVLASCCLVSCSLEKPLSFAENCPDAVYYVKGDGTKVGEFSDPDDAYYKVYSMTQHCPEAYPICTKNANGTFCHEMCRENEVFCVGRCISPLENSTYCGARGLCIDTDPDSADYMGETCSDVEMCRKGACVCARSTDILCDGKCIDPSYNMAYCGAKGACSDTDRNSLNYKGQQCDRSQRCNGGKCTCGRVSDIMCDGKCIDPAFDTNHCGAASGGLCSDPNPNSTNFSGVKCLDGMRCNNGACICTKDWEIICGEDGCIDPNLDNNHCGAASSGLCNDPNPGSTNYMGEKCDGGRRCEDGTCKCANQSDVFCDGKCIDPRSHHEHCGASGLCNHDEPDNADFFGGNCSGFGCLNGVCQCGDDGYHLYHNSCERDSQNHCGEHGNVCKLGQYDAKVDCLKGKCTVVECQAGVSFFSAPKNFGAGNDVLVNAIHQDESCMTCDDLVKNATIGDTIYFGHYPQLSENSSDKQPLAWQVLDVDDEKGVLLMTKFVLEPRKYNETGRAMTWERSTIRSWLNGFGPDHNDDGIDYSGENAGFIQVAFNAEEQKCIQTVTNNNQDNVYFETEGGEPTEDRIFFLDMCQVDDRRATLICENSSYFETKEDRKSYATDYARHGFPGMNISIDVNDSITVRYGEYTSVRYATLWWLRTPSQTEESAVAVYDDGSVGNNNLHITLTTIGVRPVLWIK